MITEKYAKEELKLSDEEYIKLKKWYDKIVKKRGSNYWGAIGGSITFHITPTSIGTIVEAECNGKKITLRELD